MVARGDMAVEAGPEVVPIVQSRIIGLCRKHAKLCIVATQMLSSMVDNPEPTRAEVNDIAMTVVQGADTVMLSDETANGKYPLEAIKMMKKVILNTQNHSRISPLSRPPEGESAKYDAISDAAARLSEKLEADVIVCQTATGATARAIAGARPNLPIISVSPNPRVANQLALIYANSGFVREYEPEFGYHLACELKESGYLQPEEGREDMLAVIVSGDKNKFGTDTIMVRGI